MPQEVQELFNEVPAVAFATANPESDQPNISVVGMKKIIDDETVYLSDQFFKKTLEYGLANNKVAVTFWGDKGAYQLYGTAIYINEGAQYDELAA